eukprot:scaffold129363_cov63-Phaeocystis_antarctica.AAC.1
MERPSAEATSRAKTSENEASCASSAELDTCSRHGDPDRAARVARLDHEGAVDGVARRAAQHARLLVDGETDGDESCALATGGAQRVAHWVAVRGEGDVGHASVEREVERGCSGHDVGGRDGGDGQPDLNLRECLRCRIRGELGGDEVDALSRLDARRAADRAVGRLEAQARRQRRHDREGARAAGELGDVALRDGDVAREGHLVAEGVVAQLGLYVLRHHLVRVGARVRVRVKVNVEW